ncbi:hypothetical protein [Aureimonas ureilytica]|uniref:hypothetical protein n=1 Tax=Aureimonas ureilytica TaxID=401562 RepID=UPI00037050D6|nr:hypothetical protein [Aureimonas ureilytica]
MSSRREEDRPEEDDRIIEAEPVEPGQERHPRRRHRPPRPAPDKRSPWRVGLFLHRFLIAVAIGMPAIFLIAETWEEAFLWSGVLVVALQAIYLALALLLG